MESGPTGSPVFEFHCQAKESASRHACSQDAAENCATAAVCTDSSGRNPFRSAGGALRHYMERQEGSVWSCALRHPVTTQGPAGGGGGKL